MVMEHGWVMRHNVIKCILQWHCMQVRNIFCILISFDFSLYLLKNVHTFYGMQLIVLISIPIEWDFCVLLTIQIGNSVENCSVMEIMRIWEHFDRLWNFANTNNKINYFRQINKNARKKQPWFFFCSSTGTSSIYIQHRDFERFSMGKLFESYFLGTALSENHREHVYNYLFEPDFDACKSTTTRINHL